MIGRIRLGRWGACGALGLLLAACSGSLEPPSVDVTGIWSGTWDAQNGEEHGVQTVELFQQGAAVTGSIYLMRDLPNLFNVGVEVEGTVEGDTVTFRMQSDENPHVFTGTVQGDEVAGQVSYRGGQGTWQAAKLPGGTMEKKGSSAAKQGDPWHLAFDGQHLWYTDRSTLSRFDRATYEEEIVNTDVDLIRCQSGMTFDGTHLLCSGSGSEITKLDRSGKKDGKLEVDLHAGNVAFDGQHLWIVQGVTNALHQVDPSTGTTVKELPRAGASTALAWGMGHLWQLQFYPPVLFKIDTAGAVVAAYHLPPEVAHDVDGVRNIPRALEVIDDTFWVGVWNMSLDPSPAASASRKGTIHQLAIANQ